MIAETINQRMQQRLNFVYGPAVGGPVAQRIAKLIESYAQKMPQPRSGWDQSDAMLITYADSIVAPDEPPLGTLNRFLGRHVGDRLSFIHLLPFYPFTSDDGFSVVDYRQVRADLGSWDDVAAMAKRYRLVFDAVVNHVSVSSKYIQGFLAGDEHYRDFAISLPPDTDTRSVLRTRNLPLLHDYDSASGKTWLWTTFSRDQVDLNFANPQVLMEILDVLLFYGEHGASVLRLDAIPYLWKQLGTSCAHLRQTHELIKLIRDVFDAAMPGMLLLTETNVPHRENIVYFGDHGDEAQIIYNFALAPLILFSLHSGDATALTRWAADIAPAGPRATYLNITATHDGIGMRPTEGLLTEPERQQLLELARSHHGDITGKRNPDGSISPYELNLNYFDAVNHPDSDEPIQTQIDRFMLSQAIPLALTGIPGIYIHSLLGSRNDLEGVKRTGRARSINREQLQERSLVEQLADPQSPRARVLSAYLHLLDARSQQPALHPDAPQEVLDLAPALFAVRRTDANTGKAAAGHPQRHAEFPIGRRSRQSPPRRAGFRHPLRGRLH